MQRRLRGRKGRGMRDQSEGTDRREQDAERQGGQGDEFLTEQGHGCESISRVRRGRAVRTRQPHGPPASLTGGAAGAYAAAVSPAERGSLVARFPRFRSESINVTGNESPPEVKNASPRDRDHVAFTLSVLEVPQNEAAISMCGQTPARVIMDHGYVSVCYSSCKQFIIEIRKTLNWGIVFSRSIHVYNTEHSAPIVTEVAHRKVSPILRIRPRHLAADGVSTRTPILLNVGILGPIAEHRRGLHLGQAWHGAMSSLREDDLDQLVPEPIRPKRG